MTNTSFHATPIKIAIILVITSFQISSCTVPTNTSNQENVSPSQESMLSPDAPIGDFTVYYMGHSLLSDVPDMTEAILNDFRPGSYYWRGANLPGAPLRYHWDNSGPQAANPDPAADPTAPWNQVVDDEPSRQLHYSVALPSGNYSHVIVTDSVPRGWSNGDSSAEDETVLYLGYILEAARAGRNDVRVFYYETWHHITSGLPGHDPWNEDNFDNNVLGWRERIDADAVMWDRIVARVNEEHPAGPGQYPVTLLPAGRILAGIVDAMNDGQISGYTQLGDLFIDTIHTNVYGKYLVAAMHASMLTLRAPQDFEMDITNVHGGVYFNQEIVAGYNDDGSEIRATYPEFNTTIHGQFMNLIQEGVDSLY